MFSGTVISLFECDEKYNRAIEVIAEGRLFYHVVRTDKIATDLMEILNEKKMPGEFNFFPMNRVVSKNKRKVADKVNSTGLSLDECLTQRNFRTQCRCWTP